MLEPIISLLTGQEIYQNQSVENCNNFSSDPVDQVIRLLHQDKI